MIVKVQCPTSKWKVQISSLLSFFASVTLTSMFPHVLNLKRKHLLTDREKYYKLNQVH